MSTRQKGSERGEGRGATGSFSFKAAGRLRRAKLLGEDGHGFLLALLHEASGVGDFRFGGGGILCHGQDGGNDTLNLVFLVEVEKPVAEADVAPHDALAGLLGGAADNGRDVVAD